MSPITRSPAAVVWFALSLLLGSACARVPDSSSSPPPADPFARTLWERTAAVRLDLRAVTAGARSFTLTGVAALDGSRSHLSFDARDLGVPFDGPADGEYRTVHGRTWLRPPPALLPLPTGKRWIELVPGRSLGLLSLLARSPTLTRASGRDRVQLDNQGRIRTLRRIHRKPGAVDLETVLHLERFGVPVRVELPPPEEVVAASDL